MKCPKCGFESEVNYPVCPQCQAEIQPNPAAQRILPALKDTLFLIICILVSLSCVLSISLDNFSVIDILIAVFLWLTYAQSRKDIADAKHLRCISGAVFANYVINYVWAGLVVLVGVLFAALIGNLSALEGLLTDVADTDLSAVTEMLSVVPSVLILVVFLVVGAVMVVFNIFSLRYIHRFAQSVYKSIEAGVTDLKHTNAAKIWLFVYGGLSALDCLSADGVTALLLAAVNCAACILAGILINKYLINEPVAPAAIETETE